MTPEEADREAARIAALLRAEGLPMEDSIDLDLGAQAGFTIRLQNGRRWGFRVQADSMTVESVRDRVREALAGCSGAHRA